MKNKRLLIIGGTAFIGRVLVEKLIEKGGYDITLFHRGKTNPGLFPELEHILGDRNTDDVQLLANRQWDAVADISGYYPASQQNIAEVLKGNVGRYVYVSTVSVFPLGDEKHTGAWTEHDTILPCTPKQAIAPGLEDYGEKKAECERVLLASGLDAIILRPSFVFGRHDYTDRLYYWLHKVWHDEPFLLPNNGQDAISCTYVEDLADAIITSLDVAQHNKVYNLVSHPSITFADITNSAATTLGKKLKPINASTDFLKQHNVRSSADLPLWITGNLLYTNNQRALTELGLNPTPIPKMIAATLQWHQQEGWPLPKAGMNLQTEQELIGVIK